MTRDLIAEIQSLSLENVQLRREIEFLRGNPSIARGMKGETLIVELLAANFAKPGSGHDIVATDNQLLIEVKYSSLLKAIGELPIRRWAWTKLFGELGKKRYDRLLLLGDSDPRFAYQYLAPESPYVIFDIPYDEAVSMVGGVRPGRLSRLHLTTNPSTVKSSRAKALFQHYQVSPAELRYRYPSITTYLTPGK